MKKILIFFFALLLVQSGSLGLSDDEAYYWVLAQKPALGYAFHPPGVAWVIALFQTLFGRIFGNHSALLVRLPAVIGITLIVWICLDWFLELGYNREKLRRAAMVLGSFAGFFSLSWMMVPDIPLFLGWTVAFVTTWRICFTKVSQKYFVFLFLSVALILLSKYSGVLAIFSIFLSFCLWAPQQQLRRAQLSLFLGCSLGLVPILLWNSEHQWSSILYQIRDRHSGEGISVLRWARFWGIELALAGPPLIFYSLTLFKKAIRSETVFETKLSRFFLVWVVPAAIVFCLQPLFSSFKPHWAFIVWWPVAISLAWESRRLKKSWITFQVMYGLLLGALVLLTCHVPWIGWFSHYVLGKNAEATLDVTNDFYGWSNLSQELSEALGSDYLIYPILASRYQTASQTFFNLPDGAKVSHIPRDLKAQDEWPNLFVSESQGPEWPKLSRTVLFIADNRYSEPPLFPGAHCRVLKRFTNYRFGLIAKWIDVWKCDP